MRAASGPSTGGGSGGARLLGRLGLESVSMLRKVASRSAPVRVPLPTVLREWGRLGLIGFGGPPAHVALLRELVVDRRGWIEAREFEDANAACQLLPGPGSTQLAIYCAHRVGGLPGALVGGLAFILPGLLMVLAIAASRSATRRRSGSWGSAPAPARRSSRSSRRPASCSAAARSPDAATCARRLYIAAGFAAAVLAGPFVVLVLLAAGLAGARLAPARAAPRCTPGRSWSPPPRRCPGWRGPR